MAKADVVKVKIQNLINKANATTGKNDTDLTSGVYNLVQGYGSGGGSSVVGNTSIISNKSSLIIETASVVRENENTIRIGG